MKPTYEGAKFSLHQTTYLLTYLPLSYSAACSSTHAKQVLVMKLSAEVIQDDDLDPGCHGLKPLRSVDC